MVVRGQIFILSLFSILVLNMAYNTSPAYGAKGIAKIQGTADNSNLTGIVHLTETEEGLKIDADLFNVPDAGNHGFHIHDFGSCDDNGKAAGGHFNPNSVMHGFLVANGHAKAHVGDMGNITVDEEGKGTLSLILPDVKLSLGKYNVAGRAIILHAKEDDGGQPTGNAGSRIGCGTILIVGK